MITLLFLLKPNKQNILIWMQLILFMFLILSGKTDAINFVLLYFIESIIIGLFHFLFLLKLKSNFLDENLDKTYTAVFFLIHYLFFIFIQSIFVFVIISNKLPEIIEPFNLLENFLIILKRKGILILISIVGISQLVKFLNKIKNKDFYLQYKISEVMMQPYPRVIIQQLVVIISMFFVIFTNAIAATAILLILIIGLLDLIWIGLRNSNYFTQKLIHYMKTENQTEEEIQNILTLFSHS